MTNEKNGEIIEVQKEKKMKKILSILLMCILSASFVFAGGSSETTSTVDLTTPMTHEELVAAAQAEGTLTIYTHSSRTTTIADSFEELYGINVEVTQLSDSEMIEKVSKEAIADLDAADVIYCQDGSRVYPELLMTGYVVSYTPDNVKGNIIDPQYENPLVWEVVNKVFVYNNENSSEQPLTNVWQLTEPEWAGRVQFKDPFSEAVNMNFFTMVTREDWAEKLAQAYKDLYGKELVLTTPNAGYEWIKMLYANDAVLGKSDTTIAENVGAKGQSKQLAGLFTLNKLRTAEAKNLALAPAYNMEPFSGFMYPAYVFITKNAKSPNAAKLFIEYSMTEEGWVPFNTMGDYSPVSYLQDNSEDPLTLTDWSSQLIYEDYQWCAQARADVEEFITSIV